MPQRGTLSGLQYSLRLENYRSHRVTLENYPGPLAQYVGYHPYGHNACTFGFDTIYWCSGLGLLVLLLYALTGLIQRRCGLILLRRRPKLAKIFSTCSVKAFLLGGLIALALL